MSSPFDYVIGRQPQNKLATGLLAKCRSRVWSFRIVRNVVATQSQGGASAPMGLSSTDGQTELSEIDQSRVGLLIGWQQSQLLYC